MANTCSYTARIKGRKQNVVDFLHWLRGSGPKIEVTEKRTEGDEPRTVRRICTGYVGRIGYDNSSLTIRSNRNEYLVELCDECAWSVNSSGVAFPSVDNRKSIPTLTEEFGLEVEIFSVEYGMGFDEYYYFNGNDPCENEEDEFSHDGREDELESLGYTFNENYQEWLDPNGDVVEMPIDIVREHDFPWEWRYLLDKKWESRRFKRFTLSTFLAANPGSWTLQ